MKSLDDGRREKLQDRLMFGSDFSINLLRVESYSAWWRIVETSVLSDDLVHRMVSVNPARFLGYSLGLVAYILLNAEEKWLKDSKPVMAHTSPMLFVPSSRSLLAVSSLIDIR